MAAISGEDSEKMADDPRLLLWRRRPDTASVDLNGRVLVLPLDVSPMGSPYALRESVAATWRALDDEPQDFSGLADRLARLHSTDPGAIADDLARMLSGLEELLLVESSPRGEESR
ncbi:hypothetical protein C5B95_09900 [Rathayibacter sp. AY1A7]|nr:hypothetical protein C5B95_09900 [Rathayibacter sp. AY1A7]